MVRTTLTFSISKYKTKDTQSGKMEYNLDATASQPLYLLKQSMLHVLSINLEYIFEPVFGSRETPRQKPATTISTMILVTEIIQDMIVFSWEEQSLFVPMTVRIGLSSRRTSQWESDAMGRLISGLSTSIDIFIVAQLPLSTIQLWFFTKYANNALYTNKAFKIIHFLLLKRRRFWNYGLDFLVFGDEDADQIGLVDFLVQGYPFTGLECDGYCKSLCHIMRLYSW